MRINLMSQQEELNAHVEILRKAYPNRHFPGPVALVPLDASVPHGVYGVMVPFRDRNTGLFGWLSVEPDGTAVEVESLPAAEDMMS